MDKAHLYVFTGTSGSGRKTAAHRALHHMDVTHIPSYTDRPPRDMERPDRDYHYVGKERFDLLSKIGFFAEEVRIGRARYGLSRRDLEAAMRSDGSAYIIVNREGADVIRSLYGERAIRIFLYVAKRLVAERLEAKGLPFDVVDGYLSRYTEEVTYRKECEHVIENLNLNDTVAAIKDIVVSLREPHPTPG